MNSTKPPRPRQTDLPSSGVSRAVGGSETAKPDLADALIDLLDGKVSLHPRGEAARDLGRPPAQGHLRADGVLAEVDAARPLRTCHVLGERDRSRPRWGSVAATLDLGPQIEALREAVLDRVPRSLGLKRSRHYVRSLLLFRHRPRSISPRTAAFHGGCRINPLLSGPFWTIRACHRTSSQ